MAHQQILTPDRRLRVFVSSTLRELAAERVAAREAIAALHLAPVLFEQGARPHAPRDLYAAYVAQCDVFVGIYWQSYGWIAPTGRISGLEDELELAQGKPMLLYIKEPAPEREEALTRLIQRIEETAGPAYRTFSAAEELRALVTDDLALLLTERFHSTAARPEEPSRLPARTTSFVGRDRELAELLQLMERSDVRLVTLTGPGGIGKTRLAVETARRLAPRFAGGVAYVALDRLVDPELVPTAIAAAVAAPLGPDPETVLARHLHDRELLLVLDNFEHLLDAAPVVTRLLEACEDLQVIATSREPLRLQGEHEVAVPPLADARTLFMERVAAVRADVVWDDENLRARDEICRRVDGLPLAVELVAAGARTLLPRALVEHVGSSLDAPSTSRRDAPARQQTIRATIDWSYGLLTDRERDLFERLGVFAGSFTIEAAGSVAADPSTPVLTTLSSLVDKSLLVHAASESETRFRMLQVVAEYAAERLDARADADIVREAHAAYYVALAEAAHTGLRGSERGWAEVLDLEAENVRLALGHLVRQGRDDAAATIVWSVWPHWLAGHLLQGRMVVGELLAAPGAVSDPVRARMLVVDGLLAALLSDIATAQAELAEALAWFDGRNDDEAAAMALAGLGIATAPVDPDRARTHLVESAELFASWEDVWAEAMILGALGWLDTGRGDFTDETRFERAYALAHRAGDEVATGYAATNLAELRLALERRDEARELVDVSLDAYEALRLHDGLSYALEAAARYALSGGRAEDAASLLGAADGLRAEAGVPIWGARLTRFEAFESSLRSTLGDATFDAARAGGRALDFDAALEAARRALRSSEAAKPTA